MSKIPDLREIPELPSEVISAGLSGNLILFIGAGVSRLLGLPSWTDLAFKALDDLRDNGFLNFSELEQLKELRDPKKQLSIASLIAKENDFALDLTKHLVGKAEGNSIFKALNDIGCPCVTTNYDLLLAPRYLERSDGSTTPLPVNRISGKEKLYANLLNQPGSVIHLHGCIEKPETMIVSTQDYLEHYDNENVKTFLSELFQKKTILFLGYGLEEAEILEHIFRRSAAKPAMDRRHFLLQGFFLSQAPLYKNLHNYYEKSFGVHLIGFVRDHMNFGQLDGVIKVWGPQIEVKKPPLASDYDFMDEVFNEQ